MSGTVELRVTPDQKESTCSNVFNFINVLAGFAYLCYQFSIEFGNWEKITDAYNRQVETQSFTNPETNRTKTTTWIISVADEAESQVMRLEEVCSKIDLLQNIFLATVALTSFWSGVGFIRRQYKICCNACKCVDSTWSISMFLIFILTVIQSIVGLFIILLLSPTSFLTCYRDIARYFCTISVSVLTVFFLYNIILASLSKPVLAHTIQYTELTSVGSNCEVDVVRQKARRKRKVRRYDDDKDNSEEEVELTEQYSDKKYEDDTV